MAKNIETEINSEGRDEAFEMIELAIGDLDLIARAFDVINEACQELESPSATLEAPPPRVMIN